MQIRWLHFMVFIVILPSLPGRPGPDRNGPSDSSRDPRTIMHVVLR